MKSYEVFDRCLGWMLAAFVGFAFFTRSTTNHNASPSNLSTSNLSPSTALPTKGLGHRSGFRFGMSLSDGIHVAKRAEAATI